MQVVGYELGTGAGKVLGEVAAYAGLFLLAVIGGLMVRSSFRKSPEPEFDATRGTGLLMTSLSISLDSLGVGSLSLQSEFRSGRYWSRSPSLRLSSRSSDLPSEHDSANAMRTTRSDALVPCSFFWPAYSRSNTSRR